MPAEPVDPPEDPIEPEDAGEAEGRGDAAGEATEARPTTRSSRGRAKKPAAKTKPRNLRLSDDVADRLWQLARSRRATASAVANELLDKALPRWEIKRQA